MKSFPGLECPECHDIDTISITVDNGKVHCCSCHTDLNIDQVKEQVTLWTSFLKWVELVEKV